EHPGARRRGIRVADELEDKWQEKRRAIFHRVKNEEFSRTILKYLRTRSPDIEAARSWVTTELEKEVIARTRARLDMTREEAEQFAETKAKGAPHWATYEGGSFVISKRAKVGSSSKRQIRGDPNKWWDKYDVDTRSGWLRAYAAERLDLFEVVRINLTDCTRCGGTGKVKKMSLTGLADGRHEWKEVCPRCFGARQDRGVAYK
ncbi:MAG: hypothetical protein OER88_07170, partial [Planctomycetota bacterium]|nr:hypothetical protein [Planctomycetota bacterium]